MPEQETDDRTKRIGRYSKIYRRIHHDEKFRTLSSPKPNGQSLFLYLLTTPKLTSIPGLICAGELELCEALEWPLEGFRKGFAELFAKGMAKADWKARLVWLPKACEYNRPENPNVVKSWRIPWDEIPECQIKIESWQSLKELTEGLGEGFAKAFAEGLPKPRLNGMANQEQEPLQKQKQKSPPTPQGVREGFDEFWRQYPKHEAKESAAKVWEKIAPDESLREIISNAVRLQAATESWRKENGRYVPLASTWLNGRRWQDEVQPPVTNGSGTIDEDMASLMRRAGLL